MSLGTEGVRRICFDLLFMVLLRFSALRIAYIIVSGWHFLMFLLLWALSVSSVSDVLIFRFGPCVDLLVLVIESP